MLKQYESYLRAEHKSERTIASYVDTCTKMMNYIDKKVYDITYADLIDWKGTLADLSPSSINQNMAAVKNFFNYCQVMGFIKSNPAADMKRLRANPKESIYVGAGEIEALLAACRSLRDRTMLTVMVKTGVRQHELANITIRDYFKMRNEGSNRLVVLGKGNKERSIYFSEDTMELIDEYVIWRNEHAVNSDRLFLTFAGLPLNDSGMNRVIKNCAKRAGLANADEYTCHSLRRAFATIKSNNGVPVAIISKALGHSNIATTTRYIKTNDELIEAAMV